MDLTTPHPEVDEDVLRATNIRKLNTEFRKMANLVQKTVKNDINMIGKDIPRLSKKIFIKIDDKNNQEIDPTIDVMVKTASLCRENLDFDKIIKNYEKINKTLHQEITEYAKSHFSRDSSLILLTGIFIFIDLKLVVKTHWHFQ